MTISPHQPHGLRHESSEPNVTVTASNEVPSSARQLHVAAISATASAGQR
jgi:hypothetical protein